MLHSEEYPIMVRVFVFFPQSCLDHVSKGSQTERIDQFLLPSRASVCSILPQELGGRCVWGGKRLRPHGPHTSDSGESAQKSKGHPLAAPVTLI